ncbi:MAG: hypothetical protein ACI81V_000110 [Lentimonas sp.]|jgi:hypothetical protein
MQYSGAGFAALGWAFECVGSIGVGKRDLQAFVAHAGSQAGKRSNMKFYMRVVAAFGVAFWPPFLFS